MNRWLRWQFVMPRLLLCMVAALGAHFAAGLAVRSIAMRSGTQLFGSHVGVADARLLLSDGHVLLGAMSVADPRDPSKCWLTAECCELEVATAPLLAKQMIIPTGRMSGVRFGGSAKECASEIHTEASAVQWFNGHAVETAEDRLAKIDDRFDEDFLSRLESVRRTAKFCTGWPDEIASLDARAAKLERSAAELEKTLGTASANQLRHYRLLDEASANAVDLRRDLESLSNDFGKLPQRLEEERRLIVAARRQDEELLRDKMHVEAIDAELLNAYLLRDLASRQMDGLMTWVRCLRQVAPAAPARPLAAQTGVDVLFAGVRPTPNFLIQALELQGEARLLGLPVEFRGLVSNLTTTPSIHGEPIQLRLSAKGSTPFEVRATIDRTCGRLHDELFVDYQEIPLGDQLLGRAEQLQLKMAPSTGSLTMSVSVDGDKLSGEIQLVQKQLRIAPTFACEGKALPIGKSLDESLGQFNSLATRISLDGTIDNPTCTLWSNLGPAVAESLDHGLQQHAEAHAREVLAEARRHVDERLAELERQLAEHQEKFAITTASVSQRFDAIARAQERRNRMSAEQAGRRLPTTSILR